MFLVKCLKNSQKSKIIITVLTLYVQRDGGLQPLAGGHRSVPHHTAKLGTVVVAVRRHRQRAGRLVVLGAALAEWRLQRHGAALSVPTVNTHVQREAPVTICAQISGPIESFRL